MKTLKYEEVYLREYETMTGARTSLSHFLEAIYNQKRLYSTIGYLPPFEFEQRNIQPVSPLTSSLRLRLQFTRRGIERSEKLCRHRWMVERTHVWFNRYRWLMLRDARSAEMYLAFLQRGGALICWNFLGQCC